MEANNFVAKLKADGSANDLTDLAKLYQQYKAIISSLPAKDRGTFSLNILCILCRNLDKVPSWRSAVDPGSLLPLTIDCLRECRVLLKADQVKTLAALFHIHKYVVAHNASTSPELVLKASYMAFEREPSQMLKEYCKTYWNILVDRITYVEKLKNTKRSISKLLPKIIEDLTKVIQIFDSVIFCMSNLVYTVKKLHYLFNDTAASELNKAFGRLFECLSAKEDLKLFKKLTEKEMLDLYVKLNDCLYVVAENSSKINFKESTLSLVVRVCISIIGHCPDLHHCLQNFQLNIFCSLLSDQCTATYTDTIFNSLLHSCETAEKLGYNKAMYATYPYLNQFLRLYIDFYVANSEKWGKFFTVSIQECCLKIIMFLMRKLRHCHQILKCENCKIKTGLHDSLRLSFSIKYFIELSTNAKMNISDILGTYHKIVDEQNIILNELQKLGCTNYTKYYRKYQTDVHNSAILLNRSQYFKVSIKLFDCYLHNEIKNFDLDSDQKNISRALYNKSICELDAKLYEHSLINAYLSLVFEYKNLGSDKYMNLVMDVKNKFIKTSGKNDEIEGKDERDELIIMTVYEACDLAIKRNMYGDLKPFFSDLQFSKLLSHEFEMYKKAWAYMGAIAGVCKSIAKLIRNKPNWMTEKNENLHEILYNILLETPTFAITICDHRYDSTCIEILQLIDEGHKGPTEMLVQATLLFIRSEYELGEASKKYKWNVPDPSLDPDNAPVPCTIAQEHDAIKHALQAVQILTQAVKDLDSVPQDMMKLALKTAEVFVAQLVYLYRTIHGMQLAYLCCCMADRVDDKESYVRNAGVIVYNSYINNPEIDKLILKSTTYCHSLVADQTVDSALNFMCEKAIYTARFNNLGAAARLLQVAQAKILSLKQQKPDINLDLSTGRLLEGQILLCRDSAPSFISAVNSLHRHYLSFEINGSPWHRRRARSRWRRARLAHSALRSSRACAALHCWRRARSAAASGLHLAPALPHADLYAGIINTYVRHDAEAKIECRLKYILGLNTKEAAPTKAQPTGVPITTPRQNLEIMLENCEAKTFKIQEHSPNSSEITQYVSFVTPPFLTHDSRCQCPNCQLPHAAILTVHTCQLEASVYFRSNQLDVARDYFENTLKCFDLAKKKIKDTCKFYNGNFEQFILDSIEKNCLAELKNILIGTLIEASFCELADQECEDEANLKKADEYIIRIYELMQTTEIDSYLHNQVMNLVVTSSQVRKLIKNKLDMRIVESGLEKEMESLKLSPTKVIEQPKTPESKTNPPKIPKVVVKDEELPKTKRRVIKLNLDEIVEEKSVKRTSSRIKQPCPTFLKPELELMTPMTVKKAPSVFLTQSSVDENVYATPKPKPNAEDDFATPLATPSEQFFTPMTSLKTYAKKSLRKDIVKNLEAEFSTPKMNFSINKENIQLSTKNRDVPTSSKPKVTRSRLDVSSKKTLKRATSPGKLLPEKPRPSTRVKKPINFDNDSKK